MISLVDASPRSPTALVDSSVWIEVFHPKHPFDLFALVPRLQVATCLTVVQEVLQGFRDEALYHCARQEMLNLTFVENPLGLDVVQEAVELYRKARKQGITIRSSQDCLIASCALRHDLEVLHRDRDYPLIARVSRLRQREV